MTKLKIITKDKVLILFAVLFFILSFSCEKDKTDVSYKSIVNKDGSYEMGTMHDSLRQGLWIRVASNGILLETQFYNRGELVGPYRMFYENGSPKFNSYIRKGEFDGKRVTYYSNGQIQDEGFFKKGKPDSIWSSFSESGKLNKKVRFKNGIQLEVIIDNNFEQFPPIPVVK
jgi:antitoxin component YwqK of YwqJK toxin-antitoxin module